MHVIWKQTLAVMPSQSVNLPEKAEILTVQFHHDILALWFKCDPHTTLREERHFHIYGTGHQTLPDNGDEKYIATVQQAEGNLVWHIYEAKQY
jgi:hypothetical protein